MALQFSSDQLDRPEVQALLALHFETMRRISPPEACHVLPPTGLDDCGLTLWAAREGETLAGIGALKRLDAQHGEVKSMRVAEAFLGRGIGRAILRHIMAEARKYGLRRLSLETGNSEPFAAALALYESEGFAPCAPFGDYQKTPFTRFFTRIL